MNEATGSLRLRIADGSHDAVGTPLFLQLLNSETHERHSYLAWIGGETEATVPAGTYTARLTLPTGQTLTDSVDVHNGQTRTHSFELNDPAGTGLRTRFDIFAPHLGAMARTTPPEDTWVRLWRRVIGRGWTPDELDGDAVCDGDNALRLRLPRFGAHRSVLQVGGSAVPWTCLVLPPGDSAEVLVWIEPDT